MRRQCRVSTTMLEKAGSAPLLASGRWRLCRTDHRRSVHTDGRTTLRPPWRPAVSFAPKYVGLWRFSWLNYRSARARHPQ